MHNGKIHLKFFILKDFNICCRKGDKRSINSGMMLLEHWETALVPNAFQVHFSFHFSSSIM